MSSRKFAPPTIDKEIFRRTASHSKAINLGAIIHRGGIRF